MKKRNKKRKLTKRHKCNCHLYERMVCDICQGVVGKKLKDKK